MSKGVRVTIQGVVGEELVEATFPSVPRAGELIQIGEDSGWRQVEYVTYVIPKTRVIGGYAHTSPVRVVIKVGRSR